MSAATENATFSIGIIGGGRRGHGLLGFFGASARAKVAWVADPSPSAPAVEAARQRGIQTWRSDEDALQGHLPDYLFDCSGDPELEARLRQRLRGTETLLVNADTSRMMVAVFTENTQRLRDDIAGIVGGVKTDLGESIASSGAILDRINGILSTMQMLALNASIEAAKAGSLGRGFSVVADHLGKSVEAVRALTQEIDKVNRNIAGVSEKADAVLAKVADTV